ncbi:MAG: hypothetical protein NVSMB47_04010 [Polyangiales bacterium]
MRAARWLLAATLAGLGCGGARPVNLQEGPREYVAADYDALLQRWTRSGRLYSFQGIDDVLSVSGTFEAWEFRWAYVVRYADDYRLTIDQRRELLSNALEDARRHHQFYVSLYGNRPRESDLTSQQPAWVVRMVDDRGHVTAPEDIIPIKKPGVLEKTYFPYTSPWRTTFRVRFPAFTAAGPTIGADAKVVTLRFSGPLGTLELPWTLAPPQ